MRRIDWIWITVLGVGWGAAFFCNEILLRELGPVSVSAARIGVAALAAWGLLIVFRRPVWFPPKRLLQMGIFGMAMYGLPFAIFPIGQQWITAGAAGIINALTPIMVVIVSQLWPGGERATPLKVLGVLAGFGGIVLLSVPALQAGGQSELGGIFLSIFAPLCYGIALNYVRRLADVDRLSLLAWSLSLSTLGIGTVALTLEGAPASLSAQGWAALLVVGVALTAIAFAIFYWLLPRVGATRLSTVTFIAPVSAVMLGILFLGETMNAWKAGGMAAIFLGILLIDGTFFQRLGRGLQKSPKDQPLG
ncbi:MAG: DMT family transporter [Pseudomonadota bacterium]